jgi:NTE family protein
MRLGAPWILLLAGACIPAMAAPPDCVAALAIPRTTATAPQHPYRVGLALGSGSSHGFAHIGVIRELEARGLATPVVTGTSSGAIFGALWASGLDGRELERVAREGRLQETSRWALSSRGLMSNEGLREQLARSFAGRPIESWPRRFGAVATNVDNGHRRLLVSGDGALAVQASAAVPMIYAPVKVGSENLADGALVEPVPVRAARDLGADFVIAVDVAYRPYEDAVGGITGYGFQAMHILVNTLAREQLDEADIAIRLDVHRELMSCGPDALIAAGRQAVERAWPEITRALQRSRVAR